MTENLQEDETVSDESYFKLDFEQCKLSEAEKQLVTHFVKQNIKRFAMKLDDLGCNKDYPHVIRTRTAKPIAQRYYPTLPFMQREIEKQLHELKHSIDKQVSDAPVQYRYDLKSCIRGVEVSRRIARDNVERHQRVN